MLRINKGTPRPFGATVTASGFNVSVATATSIKNVCVRVFDSADAQEPSSIVPMTHTVIELGDRQYKVWHVLLGTNSPVLYYQFDSDGVTCEDPCGREFTGNLEWDADGKLKQPKAIARRDDFDWEDDKRPGTSMSDTIVYELNPRHFTDRGFLGIVERAAHLKTLCTTVELMPAQQGDPDDVLFINPRTQKRNKGAWCYNTWGYFAPDGFLASSWGQQVREFKTMVKRLHRQGLEVVLDMVFNHTREGGQTGPVINFKALGASEYYFLRPDGVYPDDFTGCGNTFNVFSPLAIEFILECLRFWYNEMHIDGVRFDLFGVLMKNPELVHRILSDPQLKGMKIFPEPWAIGLYMVGACGRKTAEWNGKFRDEVRDFIRGEFGKINAFKTRAGGSRDMFQPWEDHWSVNFITCHDGFTLEDLVSFNSKQNWENGENGNDGEKNNNSWNCGPDNDYNGPLNENAPGAEGERVRKLPAEVRKAVLALRQRQKRNFLVALMMSQGVPLVLYGDELGRTQKGNNNAYCQPELNRMPWELALNNPQLRFLQALVALRQRYKINELDIVWHGTEPRLPDFSDGARFYAEELRPQENKSGNHLYWAANAHHGDITVTLPEPPQGQSWYVVINTTGWNVHELKVVGKQFTVEGRSNVVLVAK